MCIRDRVCDVSNNPSDYIYPRTFGKDAKQTAADVKTVVETMNGRKLGAVLKHFPGYGSNVDTHTGKMCIRDRLDTGPAILSLQNPILYVLYRNEAILTADFWEFFGVCMARINSTWPCLLYTSRCV